MVTPLERTISVQSPMRSPLKFPAFARAFRNAGMLPAEAISLASAVMVLMSRPAYTLSASWRLYSDSSSAVDALVRAVRSAMLTLFPFCR